MTNETHDFSDAKVGDEVTCLAYGKGIIKLIKDDYYSLAIEFNHGYTSYSRDGKCLSTLGNPTLYHGHVEFDIKVKEPVYEWRYACKGGESWFVSEYYKSEHDFNNQYKLNYFIRIEESKREVKS